MPQSLSRILVHLVFSTKERRPFLMDQGLRQELHRYLGGILRNLECQPLLIGGVEDHVHLLYALSRTHSVSDVVKELKRVSSGWIKTHSPEVRDFAWQTGYGAFSLSASQIAAAREYISNQEEHHKQTSFKDEYRAFLERYGVEYDERYVWD